MRLGPSCQQNLNQASKTDFVKEVKLQERDELNRSTNFPKESNHVGASTIEELMWRISFSFPLNSEPTWAATVDFHKKTPFLEFILHKVVFWFLENAFQFHSVFLPAQSDPDSARGHKWVKSDYGRMPLKVASISNITKNGSYENVIITRQ